MGSYPDMSLSDARRERSKWAAYAERGEDPIAERERQRLEAENSQNDPTFEEVAAMVFEARKERLRGDGVRGRWFSPLKLYVTSRLASAVSAP
ncbi:integrase arm-type DNA-binding domain-containing protein [uncultured Ruegeria sp.]|uniref:integrase arm-type DNA-binding domain-containing protein n=1 Tax=uncultured Ruegeria sp. TaxID=259304 RepID=UPI00344C7BAD